MGLNTIKTTSSHRRRATAASARLPRHQAEIRLTLDALRHIVQALRAGRREGEPTEISSAQRFALQQIADHPHASVNDIAARTFTHQSSVSVVVQRLVRARLVVKVTADQDRRRLRLALTAKGTRVLARMPRSVQEDLVTAIAALPAADRRTLVRVMTRLAGAVSPGGHRTPPPMFFETRAR